jgi:hypothetical protein
MFLGGLRKTMINVIQPQRSAGRDYKPEPPEVTEVARNLQTSSTEKQ